MKYLILILTAVVFIGCFDQITTPASDRHVYDGDLRHTKSGSDYFYTDTIPNILTCAAFEIFLSKSADYSGLFVPEDTSYMVTSYGYSFFTHSSIDPIVNGSGISVRSAHFYRVVTSGCE